MKLFVVLQPLVVTVYVKTAVVAPENVNMFPDTLPNPESFVQVPPVGLTPDSVSKSILLSAVQYVPVVFTIVTVG